MGRFALTAGGLVGSLGLLWSWKAYRGRRRRGFADRTQEIRGDGKLSIIIPAYNEGDGAGRAVRNLLYSLEDKERVEVIVVDGGSRDDTIANVRAVASDSSVSVRILHSSCGRGAACRLGAEEANGDILLFLHADTLLEKGFDTCIRQAFESSPAVLLTFFTFGIRRGDHAPEQKQQQDQQDQDQPLMIHPQDLQPDQQQERVRGLWFVEWAVRIRCKLWGFPYGDQALAITSFHLRQVGGFPASKMMEDFELVRRVRAEALRTGGVVQGLSQVAWCSSRRWRKRGVLRTTLLNWRCVFLYAVLGYSADEIYDIYYAPPAKEGGKQREQSRAGQGK